MVQTNFDEFGTARPREQSIGKIVNGLGAATSIALIMGVAVWGYKLAVRDVSGVPVIQALQGPMRVAPDDPGGQIAAHMGLAVNRVAAEGTAGALPDSITLGPATVTLAEEDMPGLAGDTQVLHAPTPPAGGLDMGVVATLSVDGGLNTGLPETLVSPETIPGVEVSAPATMTTSPRPRARPAPVAKAVDVASIDPADAIAAAAAAALADVLGTADTSGVQALGVMDAVALTEGTRLAQIGAFDDEASAVREWDRLTNLHTEIFAGKARVIQPATSAGRTFYRLRVHGFDSEEATRGFCTALESPDMRCIPVIHR